MGKIFCIEDINNPFFDTLNGCKTNENYTKVTLKTDYHKLSQEQL